MADREIINGQPHVWSDAQGTYIPEQSGVESFFEAGGGALQKAGAGVAQLAGMDGLGEQWNTEADAALANANQNPLSSLMGNIAGEGVKAAPALLAGGPLSAAAAEAAIQGATTYGTPTDRLINAGVGTVAVGAGAMIGPTIARAGGVAGRMTGGTNAVIQNMKANVDEVMAGVKGRSQVLTKGTTRTDEGLTVHKLEDDMLRGDDSMANNEGLVGLEHSAIGKKTALQRDADFEDIVRRELNAPNTGNLRKDMGVARRNAGETMGQIQRANPAGRMDQEFLDDIAGIQQGYDHKLADKLPEVNNWTQLEDMQQWLNKAKKNANTEGKQVLNAADDALKALRERNITDPNMRQAYQKARRDYAVSSNILDNRAVLTQGGKFAARSFAQNMGKSFKPFREGTDDSMLGRAVRQMETLSEKHTKGSPTYEKSKGIAKMGLGLLGLGAVT